MSTSARRYYYGSYGFVRGYGTLYRTLQEADVSVSEDSKRQRGNGGSTDRNVVLVNATSGLCWWWEEDTSREEDMVPVKTPAGEQARYMPDVLRNYEALWGSPEDIGGFA